MARVFISYSRADRQFIDELVPLLRRVYGQDSLWYDDQIHGGANWWHMILSEIAACELFVYLISNDSLASPYCHAEFREALRLRKQILPVIVRPKTHYPGVVADDLKQILQDTQYVDMSRGVKDTNALTQLYTSANRLLAQVPSQPQMPLTAQPVHPPPVPDRQQRPRPRVYWVVTTVVALLAIGAIVVALRGSSGEDHKATQDATGTLIAGVGPGIETGVPGPAETPTTSDNHTLVPTPTSTPAATVTPNPTVMATGTLASTPAEIYPNAGQGARLVIQRSGDTVAACTDKAGNLSTLHFDFGHNTRYTLGDLFNESAQTQAGGCWCIQLEAPRFPAPTVCKDDNTSLQNAATSSRDFWRNGTLTLTLDQTPVGMCEAQPDNLGIYQCELVLTEE